jgi:hypothetical protein
MVARIGSKSERHRPVSDADGADRLVPLHSHIDPECFYLIEGRIEVFLVDEAPKWRVVDTGQSFLVADGMKHAVRNAADKIADNPVCFFPQRGGSARDWGRSFRVSIGLKTSSV